MKLTASNAFMALAQGSGKILNWKTYVRKTTSLSQALNTGTWIDVTPYLTVPLPPIPNRIEYEVGQFTADNLRLEGSDIAWIKNNIISPAAAVSLDGSTEYALKSTPSNLNMNGSELIADSNDRGFESTVGNWLGAGNHSIVRSTTDKRTGTASGKITASAAGNGTTNYAYLPNTAFNIASGTQYTVEIWGRLSTAATVNYSIGGQSSSKAGVSTVSGTFTKIVFNFTASSTAELRIWLSAAADLYIDDISITQAYNFTINAWFKKTTDTGTVNMILSYDNNTIYELRVRDDSSNAIDCTIGDGTTTVQLAGSTSVIDSKDHLCTVTGNRQGNFIVYIDGVQVNTGSMSAVGKITSTGNLGIGRRGSSASNLFSGNIGEVQIQRGYAVTATEVASAYQEGIPFMWSAGTVVAHYKWHGNSDTKFLKDESDSANNLTGTAITQAADQVFSTYAAADKSDCEIYLEFKVEFQLTGASDIIYVFSGFIDRVKPNFNETGDKVSFGAYSVQDLGSRLPAELIAVQPLQKAADGTNDGLILPNIAFFWVMDANIASYVLTEGNHIITYEYNGGTRRAKLDDGAWVNISTGNNTLGNGASAGVDTQRVKIWYNGSGGTTNLTDDIVVTSQGTTIPKCWAKDVSTRFMLAKLYEALGITTVTFDTLEFPTYDGANRLSYLDTPPNEGLISEDKKCVISDGTNLYVAINTKLYYRNAVTGVYTLKATVTFAIDKLLYNGRNNHVWIYGAGNVARYDIGGASLSSEVTLGSSSDIDYRSMEIFDYNYTGSSYKYLFIYTDRNGGTSQGLFRQVDGSSLAVSTIVSGATLGYVGGNGIFSRFIYQNLTDRVRFRVFNNSAQFAYREYSVNGSGTWVDQGEKLAGLPVDYTNCAYNAAEDRIYYEENDTFNQLIKSHTGSSITITTIGTYDLSNTVHLLYYSSSEKLIYFTMDDITNGLSLYSTSSNATPAFLVTSIYCVKQQMTYANSRLYLLTDPTNLGYPVKLYQWCAMAAPYIPLARFEGMSITEAIQKIGNGFFYVHTISATKTGQVYLRVDSTGKPKTSGNTLTVNITNAEDIMQEVASIGRASLVRVSNDTDTVTYNGTSFNVNSLSDKRKIEISSSYLPTVLLKDIAYYVYRFFRVDRTLYRIPLGIVPLFQYEPFDNCSITFTTGKIIKTASGPIYAATYQYDGSMIVEVLL